MRAAFAANALDLLHYFERRVDPREDAADLVSETMIVAWRKIGSLPVEPEAARMWLFVTARFALRNYERGRRRRIELADALRAELVVAASAEASGASAGADAIDDIVLALPAELGELVHLVHWDGFTVDEASQLLHFARATGRRRYNKAMDLIREQLAGQKSGGDNADPIPPNWHAIDRAAADRVG